MDVRELVKGINLGAKDKRLGIGQTCIGIGPFNWVFRHSFPPCSGLYWFYFDQPVTISTGQVLKAKDVVYIGMTDASIAARLGQHMRVSRSGIAGDTHPWGAGEGWEFANGTLFTNLEQRPRHKTEELSELVRTGQLWVGWFCLTATTDDPNALKSLESEMIAKAKQEDGANPLFNINP